MGCECQDVTREMDDPGRSNEPKTSVGLKGGAEVGADELPEELLASWCRLCAQILEQKRAKGAVA